MLASGAGYDDLYEGFGHAHEETEDLTRVECFSLQTYFLGTVHRTSLYCFIPGTSFLELTSCHPLFSVKELYSNGVATSTGRLERAVVFA